MKEDIKNNNINTDDLKSILYARAYFIYIIKNNPYTQLIKIENDFIQKFKIKEIKLEKMNNKLYQ